MSDPRAGFADQFNVSRETIEKLEIYASLLRKWNKTINLVSPGTLDTLWVRHFADSAQLLSLAPQNMKKWADLGSGAGFPGAVIAVLTESSHPDLTVTLIESDQRKATFLRAVARETQTSFTVLAERCESVARLEADVISARALAPLDVLLGYVSRHIARTGTALLSKGASAASEVELAGKTWSFTCESIPSMTDTDAAILKIGEIKLA
ncbi:16S rRNA (guanine(527)-N(7))-methyltransferase RsmG [uncultured Boseongicola sp.]|jgi:16S rRNA (guanine527-N7)-methyltransferase|uniref:16S rRNA (guanine(527)-N(7))-methyltransferase RsmG n=1 Tax=uncultured Boseongicola sp. TaxID=1648499 RepID=UPI002631BE0D|nr:16S rRNA (guanine(527)-N(7))-methyltransferase RsmG [uncultured Boseongicola sp.]